MCIIFPSLIVGFFQNHVDWKMVAVPSQIGFPNKGPEGIPLIPALPFLQKSWGENRRLDKTMGVGPAVQKGMGKKDLVKKAPCPFIIGTARYR